MAPSVAKDPQSDFNLFINQMIGWARGGGEPWGGLNPKRREDQAEGLRKQADREDAKVSEAYQRLGESTRAHADAEMTNLQPLFDAQDARVREAQRRVDRTAAAIPEWKPPPTINPQDASQFVMGALAVALIGGIAGKAGWMRVSQYFNGALQGLIEGNRERAKEYHDAWQAEYESAMAKARASQENMTNILNATNVPINQMLRQAEIQAKIDGAEEKVIIARQGHADKLRQMARDEERMSDQLDMRRDQIKGQLDTALTRLGAGQRGALGGQNLDNYGKWAVAKITAGGNIGVLTAITSRWASPQRAELFNAIAKEWYDQGIDPSTFNENQIGLHVERAAQRWSKLRLEAIQRLEGSLQQFEKPLDEALAEANRLHPRAFNRPINALIKDFGSGPRTARISYANTLALTIGREYMTLVAMPVSNAQMHWGAQEQADRMVKGDMSLAEMKGFYKAVLLEVEVNRKALKGAVEASMQDVESMGVSVRPEDFGLPPRAPLTPQQMEQMYGPSAASPAAR